MAFQLKNPTTFEQQLDLYDKRGMIISNREIALHALSTRNYYRLSGYTFHMKKSSATEEFTEGSNFDNVLILYDFDSELRNTLQRYLAIIEVNIRTKISYYFSHACGPYGHYNPINFCSYEACDDFCSYLTAAVESREDLPFVKNHIAKYSDLKKMPPLYNLPLWVAVEIISMSRLSKFYRDIGDEKVKDNIAKQFGVTSSYIENWLHCLANLRNTCAHYCRIYNHELKPSISYDRKTYRLFTETLQTDKFFGYIPAILSLLPGNDVKSNFLNDLQNLNTRYEACVDFSLLGYPSNWITVFRLFRLAL